MSEKQEKQLIPEDHPITFRELIKALEVAKKEILKESPTIADLEVLVKRELDDRYAFKEHAHIKYALKADLESRLNYSPLALYSSIILLGLAIFAFFVGFFMIAPALGYIFSGIFCLFLFFIVAKYSRES